MPRNDATGPWGQGPGTGWGRGPCGAGLRRGGGRGRSMGAGAWGQGAGAGFGGVCRRGYGTGGFGPFGPGPAAAVGSIPDDSAALRAEADSLKSELAAVQKRLQELEGNQP